MWESVGWCTITKMRRADPTICRQNPERPGGIVLWSWTLGRESPQLLQRFWHHLGWTGHSQGMSTTSHHPTHQSSPAERSTQHACHSRKPTTSPLRLEHRTPYCIQYWTVVDNVVHDVVCDVVDNIVYNIAYTHVQYSPNSFSCVGVLALRRKKKVVGRTVAAPGSLRAV